MILMYQDIKGCDPLRKTGKVEGVGGQHGLFECSTINPYFDIVDNTQVYVQVSK